MSAISSRPRIQSISSAVLPSSLPRVGCADSVLGSILRDLGPAALEVCRVDRLKGAELSPPVLSLSSLREQFRRSQSSQAGHGFGLSPVEAFKASLCRSLVSTPFLVVEGQAMKKQVGALQRAGSLEEARAAGHELMESVEAAHQRIVVEALTAACASAAKKSGFGAIEVQKTADNVRVVARDVHGRALVSEIAVSRDRDPSLETEVVGVTDGSCGRILDSFDAALAEHVRASVPVRKLTGGVCELASAKEFLKKRPIAFPQQYACSHPSGNDVRRTQRLNRPGNSRQRR